MSQYSTELLARAQIVTPGGVNSPVRAFKAVGGNPLFFKQGIGPYLIDEDDHRYIDYVGSWGSLILGHAPEKVVAKVQAIASMGLGFGAPTALEVEIAELLTKLMPSLEKLRLVSTGTEATQTAIRLARGFTGRPSILKFEGCYHGHVDSLLVKAGSGLLTFGLPDSAGVPAAFTAHTLTCPFNDLSAVKEIFKTHGHEIAAIVVEPVAGNMNCVLPTPEFLPKLREISEQYGSLLIFDEVITGFRVALGGAQSLYGIKPDLTCLGKIIGGGLPVAALGGKREIMNYLAPEGPVYQAGTLSGNPVAIAAGLETLKALQQPNFYETLQKNSEKLMQGLRTLAQNAGIPMKTHVIGGMFGFFFNEAPKILCYEQVAKSNKAHFTQFFHAMLKEGVYFAPSSFESGFMSIAHDDAILDCTLHAAEKVFKTWKTTQTLS